MGGRWRRTGEVSAQLQRSRTSAPRASDPRPVRRRARTADGASVGDGACYIGEGALSHRGHAMPLLDHFHPPLSERRHWHAFHNSWATYLSSQLNSLLPEGYFAEANVQFGVEIDVAAFEEHPATPPHAVWTPPPPLWSFPLE